MAQMAFGMGRSKLSLRHVPPPFVLLKISYPFVAYTISRFKGSTSISVIVPPGAFQIGWKSVAWGEYEGPTAFRASALVAAGNDRLKPKINEIIFTGKL
jgi:hypothetical protein